jgi:TPR repeat protein
MGVIQDKQKALDLYSSIANQRIIDIERGADPVCDYISDNYLDSLKKINDISTSLTTTYNVCSKIIYFYNGGYINKIYRDFKGITGTSPPVYTSLFENESIDIRTAINTGVAAAHQQLAEIYIKDNNIEAAIDEYQSASTVFDNSKFNLGVLYLELKKYKEAVYWLRHAADNNIPEAQYNLGLLYSDGLGVEKNNYTARYWFERAAKQNLLDAQYKLGLISHFGDDVSRSEEQAIFWYQKAIDNGHSGAMYNLGSMYLLTDERYIQRKGLELIQQSAISGNHKAQLALGSLYFHENIINPQNMGTAKWFLDKAVRNAEADSYTIQYAKEMLEKYFFYNN